MQHVSIILYSVNTVAKAPEITNYKPGVGESYNHFAWGGGGGRGWQRTSRQVPQYMVIGIPHIPNTAETKSAG